MGTHLLEKVSVVPGFSRMMTDGRVITGITIFRIVRDHTNTRLYLSTYNNLAWQLIDLRAEIIRITPGHSFIERVVAPNYVNITSTLQ